MKIMVASDIHGSQFYCDKLLTAFDNEKPDKLILLGDLLYHGPRNDLPKDYNPKAVIKMLNSIKQHLLCVKGNCDSEVDQMVLEFPIMSEYAVFYWQKRTIFATHGHKLESITNYSLNDNDILLYGHTHIPKSQRVNGVLHVNPGSVSIPKEDSKHGYIIFEEQIVFKDLDGKIYDQIKTSN